eukprot:s3768_g10.t1
MASNLKQIEAAQRFLRGVVALGSFSEIREKQWRGVSKSLEKLSVLTPAQAAEWLAALDTELWTSAQVAEYQEKIAAKTKARGTGQDFLMLPYFLTEELAAMVVTDEDMDRDALLQKLCYHASKLTLRNASEASKAMLLVLANWHGVRKMSPQDQYQFYVNKKPLVTKFLATVEVGSQALPDLPMSWTELPKDLLKKMFPNGKPAELTASTAAEMVQLVRHYPLRKDNKLLQTSAAAKGTQAVSSAEVVSVEAVCKVVEACSRIRVEAPRETLSSASGSKGSEFIKQKPLLAIEDVKVDASGDPSGHSASQAEAKESETLTVAQQLAALKKDLPQEKNTGEAAALRARKAKGAKVMAKKPSVAATVAKEPVGKKPAAAATVAKQAATRCKGLKRPAAAVPMGREAKRQAILKLVPPALKAKYANGCAKCYHRSYCTPSCWAMRGFTLG